MKSQWWWTSWKHFLKIIIIIKSLQFTKWVLRPKTAAPLVEVENGLGDIYDHQTESFKILNENNVTFKLTPPSGCFNNQLLLLTVSSGPLNKKNRERWRNDVANFTDRVRLVFLVSSSPTVRDQSLLVTEHEKNGDIIQTSLPDGHRKLGYKILTGYVWSWLYCNTVSWVAKTDDNVELDMERLTDRLMRRKVGGKIFLCSNSPSRNVVVGRVSKGHMRGNWSVTKKDLKEDVMPDFCSGFLYMTSPVVGAALVQVGHYLYSGTEVRLTEDYLVAGVLRERLSVPLDMIETDSLTSLVWTNYLSVCPWLTTTKQTFFNDFVVRKNSARKNIQYVGQPTDLAVWKFFLCLHMEAALELLESRLPDYIPPFMWDICAR